MLILAKLFHAFVLRNEKARTDEAAGQLESLNAHLKEGISDLLRCNSAIIS